MDIFSVLGVVLVVVLVVLIKRKKPSYNTDTKLQEIKEKVSILDPRVESLNFFVDDSEAYILYKTGIFMCLKDKSGHYYDDNFLTYIAIHEIAHAMIPGDTSEHPPHFDKEFNRLLDKAKALKIYDPTIPFPNEYCGKKLQYY